ncbi:MAG TPA: RDD family protein [Thermomonas sp.]|nr:RDD family protein [Thermomonas sp.]
MANARAERAPAAFLPRSVAWSLDAACLLPMALLLGNARMRDALDQARVAWGAMATEIPRLLGQAIDSVPDPLALARTLLADPALAAASAGLQSALADLLLTPLLLYALLACLWTIGFEASAWQATPGKRALGLVVVDRDGRRLRSGRALLRFLAAGVSWLTLNLGHALAAFPPYLALHDHLSATRVLAAADRPPMPRWAWAWLVLSGLASVAALAWGVVHMQATMQAAVQRMLGPY